LTQNYTIISYKFALLENNLNFLKHTSNSNVMKQKFSKMYHWHCCNRDSDGDGDSKQLISFQYRESVTIVLRKTMEKPKK